MAGVILEPILEPIEDFFAGYPPFVYNPSASSPSEFKRLSRTNGWEPKSDPRRIANMAFQTTLIRQFNFTYGTNPSKLQDWQKLLIQMGTTNPPHAINECKTIIERIHVNLVDLTDARGDPTKPVRVFPTEKALSKYSRRTGKIFPKNGAKAGGILEFLLRNIFGYGNGSGKKRRRKKKKKSQ